jgi:hypothetical protein
MLASEQAPCFSWIYASQTQENLGIDLLRSDQRILIQGIDRVEKKKGLQI